jgi:threonine-phosphate decarboxylase
MLHGHGDDIMHNVKINFSSNVYYGGCDEGLLQHLSQYLSCINHYPEVTGESLNQIIAMHYGISPQQVLVVNGAVEAIYLVAQVFRKKSTTVFYPAFSEYEDACTINQHKIFFEPFSSLQTNLRISSQLSFVCNPNNPTGKALPSKTMLQIMDANPDVTFLIDEAYEMFTPVETSCVSFLGKLKNLIIIKSLTKKFSIPGLRLGFVISNPAMIQKLNTFRMPWAVNALALEAGKYIFRHLISLPFPLEEMIRETQWLKLAISSVGFEVVTTDTTFLLCLSKRRTACELKQFLLHDYGILIRDASNFRGLMAGHFRVAVQEHKHNVTLIQALNKWSTLQP